MNQTEKNMPLTLTVDQVAELLQISRGHCFSMVREGRIPSLRFGKRILIPRKALEAMLEGHWQPNNEISHA